MLTRELAIAAYDSGQIIPDRLTQKQHSHYVGLVEHILKLYREGAGSLRRDLHRGVHQVFIDELDCPIRRINAFCKLLDEKSVYDHDQRGRAARLRQQVFRLAAAHHPLVQRPDRLFESGELEIKHEIARRLGRSWLEIESELFSDVVQFHRLKSFEGYENASTLLSRYNVAQCQAVLFDAISMTVWADADFKQILRYAKLARLMHVIERRTNGGYLFQFDGPSSVLRPSRKYGVAFASFLPALLACRGWKMQARIQHRRSGWENYFRLSPADGLVSDHSVPEPFDSELEKKFSDQWGAEPRDGWTMIREGEVLHQDQTVFVPDFVFEHESGCRVLMEIVGYWTPEYLKSKFETLKKFRCHNILIAVQDRIVWPENLSKSNSGFDEERDLIRYKSGIGVADVLARLQRRLA